MLIIKMTVTASKQQQLASRALFIAQKQLKSYHNRSSLSSHQIKKKQKGNNCLTLYLHNTLVCSLDCYNAQLLLHIHCSTLCHHFSSPVSYRCYPACYHLQGIADRATDRQTIVIIIIIMSLVESALLLLSSFERPAACVCFTIAICRQNVTINVH